MLMDRDTDVVAMAAEYMKRVQENYCCAKCTPGKRGTRVLQDTLARIVAGRGTEGDLETIEGLAALLESCKCTLCMTSVIPVLDTVKYFVITSYSIHYTKLYEDSIRREGDRA